MMPMATFDETLNEALAQEPMYHDLDEMIGDLRDHPRGENLMAKRKKAAGQTIYVLTNLEGAEGKAKYREWRPVGVTSDPDAATTWAEESQNHDWIPFEMDDLPEGEFSTFRPRKQAPVEQRAVETAKKLEGVVNRLLKTIEDDRALIEDLRKRLGVRIKKVEQAPKQVPAEVQASLLKRADKAQWEASHPDYVHCPKCKGTGTSVTESKRDYHSCSQCSGSGWKYYPKK
jgi:hypothetical protein